MTVPRPLITVLAFDFGTRRIGVAVGNSLTGSARPLATIANDSPASRLAAIAALVEEWRPDVLVVGIPVHADGTAHATTARATHFAQALGARFRVPVEYADERHTTQAAQSILDAAGAGGGKGRALRDQVAAQVILESWFSERDAAGS
ncbi:MAG: Holliday junction resolvase RuvX [Lysobacterales bacterium]